MGTVTAPPEVQDRYLNFVELQARLLVGYGDPNSDLFANDMIPGLIEEIGNAIFMLREKYAV